MTPLLLTGLAVALPYRAGLFNVGAEGQLLMGGLGVGFVATRFAGLPPLLAWPLGVAAAALGGAAWGARCSSWGWCRRRWCRPRLVFPSGSSKVRASP